VDRSPVTLEQQITDVADLRAAAERRHALPRGTREWMAAVLDEQEIVARIRRWSQPRTR